VPSNRLIIVPDTSINVIVDMGLVRQPRVSLSDEPNDKGSLVQNLFAVEGFPPGAVFLITWTTRGKAENLEKWKNFLVGEHFLGGLWSIGYGRISVSPISGES
jgi:CRISPR/Cas system CMR subunit Cmr4 (Cas7 group RAMP superfamily)